MWYVQKVHRNGYQLITVQKPLALLLMLMSFILFETSHRKIPKAVIPNSSFLDASSHLYKRVCPLVCLNVCLSECHAKISKRDFQSFLFISLHVSSSLLYFLCLFHLFHLFCLFCLLCVSYISYVSFFSYEC